MNIKRLMDSESPPRINNNTLAGCSWSAKKENRKERKKERQRERKKERKYKREKERKEREVRMEEAPGKKKERKKAPFVF